MPSGSFYSARKYAVEEEPAMYGVQANMILKCLSTSAANRFTRYVYFRLWYMQEMRSIFYGSVHKGILVRRLTDAQNPKIICAAVAIVSRKHNCTASPSHLEHRQ
uniref:Uncharacterized protein n=1 Tax=Schistocephalus solidus TaxID=70667 RepID=A0A0V0J2A3_SCHSO